MRTLRVEFASGREVLNHYWGLLSGGGLALLLDGREAEAQGCASYRSGEKVHLKAHVCSIKKTYALDVQVLEVRQIEEGKVQTMVAFTPDSPPDDLLDAAWADGCDAPQRRSRRQILRAQVHFERLDGKEMEVREGRLVNLSTGGCCVEGACLPPPGTQVMITARLSEGEESQPLKLLGKVRWTERPDGGMMGIEFVGPLPDLSLILRRFAASGRAADGSR